MDPTSNAQTDPRGWIAAAPELENLLSDPGVAAAVQQGDAEKLRQALLARRRGPRGVYEARTIDKLLKRRRLFTSPVTTAPRLFALEGFGTRIYGHSEVASDGTYIGTLFFTALFIPVLPLAQYLVQRLGNQYQFFGQVPLSGLMRVWRALVLVGAVVAGLAAAAAVWQSSSHARVWFANGLDIPIKVSVAGVSVSLQPGDLTNQDLPVGRHRARTETSEGRQLEELEIDVPRWTDAVIYNPLGAAPIYNEQVIYRKHSTGKEPPGEVQLLGGNSFVVKDHVNYVFTQPPRQINVREPSSQISTEKDDTIHWHLDQEQGGWRECAAWLVEERKTANSIALASAIVDAEPGQAEVLDDAIDVAWVAGGSEGALAVSRRAVSAAPNSVGAHKILQHFLAVTGHRDEAQRIYREWSEREPASIEARYLRARVEDSATALRLYAELVERNPENAEVQRGLAWRLAASGRFAEALAHFEELTRRAPSERSESLWHEAWTLVALGRARDAATRVAAFADASKPPPLWAALLYARVARLPGATPPKSPDHYLALASEEPDTSAWRMAASAAFFGTKPPSPEEIAKVKGNAARQAIEILSVADDPKEALSRVAAASPWALRRTDGSLLLLLAGEAIRKADLALADRLLSAEQAIRVPPAKARDWIEGRGAPEFFELDPELEGALVLAQARAADAAGRPATHLYKLAAVRDRIPGIPSRALTTWPKPGR